MSSDDRERERAPSVSAMYPTEQTQGKSLLTAARAVHETSVNHELKINGHSCYHSAYHGGVKIEAASAISKQSQGRAAASKSRKSTVNNGRWTPAEHEAFLQGLKVYGREWKKVATCIPTRTSAQIRSHAQKYFAKVNKEQQQLHALTLKQQLSFPGGMPSKSDESFRKNGQPSSKHYIDTVNSLVENPSEVETRVCKTLASLRERYKQLEDRLIQVKASASSDPKVLPADTSKGPASAALELEQKSLRKAAEARHEMKKLESNPNKKQPKNTVTERSRPFCARVSLASMPSHGGFDSSDVIALSMLGGNLCREKIENQSKSTIKDEHSLELVRDRLRIIENERRTNLRNMNNTSRPRS